MLLKDYVDYLGGFFPDYDKSYAIKLINGWGLLPDKKIADLSKGQKQIAHVIHAFSVKPELLILDEPVAHLDSSIRRKFIAELIDLAYENKTTVIFSSHIISDVERIASRVALLKDKKIAVNYDCEQLKSSIAHLKIAADKPLQQSDYYQDLSHWQGYAQGATAKIIQPIKSGLDDFINNSPYKIEYTPMSLEDWYVEMNNES
jgi:ABC-2 type transport system ATP-binding protein